MEIINENYKLYQGDCLDIMDKLIEEGVKVDAIITDPPYGTTVCKWDTIIPFNSYIVVKEGKKEKILYKDEFILKKLKEGINIKEAEKEWKENSKEGMWEKLNKLIKPNGAIVLFGSEPFSSLLINSNIKNYKHSWVWHKKNAGNLLAAKYQPLKTTEDVMVFTSKGERVNYYPIMSSGHKDRSKDRPGKIRTDLYANSTCEQFKPGNNKRGDERYPKHLITFSNASKKNHYHPTEKPVPLLEYLIKTYTKQNELILDFTMGSGSTGVACMNTNRNFIGIELDEKYFNIAVERIENTQVSDRQKKLF